MCVTLVGLQHRIVTVGNILGYYPLASFENYSFSLFPTILEKTTIFDEL